MQLCRHIIRMCLLKTFLLCAWSLPLWAQLSVDTDPGLAPGYSASECLSYISVACIYFIDTVGLGAESTQFYQVELSNIARL